MVNNRQANDWGERAVHWLRARYVNWPIKAIARDLVEPESVVKSWWMGGRPSREKLQKLAQRFAKDGFTSFVFGEACREELRARLDSLNKNLCELRDLLDERSDSAGLGMARRKAGAGG